MARYTLDRLLLHRHLRRSHVYPGNGRRTGLRLRLRAADDGDSRGRRLLWGWLREGRTAAAYEAAGWAGVQAIPRELRLRQGTLRMEPVSELERIRGERIDLGDVRLDGPAALPVGSGSTLDIVARFAPSGPVGLVLARAPDGSEETQIIFDPGARQLLVVRERSSLLGDIETFPHVAPLELAPDEPLDLRVLLDGSVIEIFANGRTSISTRITPRGRIARASGSSGKACCKR